MKTKSQHCAQPLISNLIHRSGTREIAVHANQVLAFHWSYYFENRDNQTLIWHFNPTTHTYDLVWRVAGQLTTGELNSWIDRTTREKIAASDPTLQTV